MAKKKWDDFTTEEKKDALIRLVSVSLIVGVSATAAVEAPRAIDKLFKNSARARADYNSLGLNQIASYDDIIKHRENVTRKNKSAKNLTLYNKDGTVIKGKELAKKFAPSLSQKQKDYVKHLVKKSTPEIKQFKKDLDKFKLDRKAENKRYKAKAKTAKKITLINSDGTRLTGKKFIKDQRFRETKKIFDRYKAEKIAKSRKPEAKGRKPEAKGRKPALELKKGSALASGKSNARLQIAKINKTSITKKIINTIKTPKMLGKDAIKLASKNGYNFKVNVGKGKGNVTVTAKKGSADVGGAVLKPKGKSLELRLIKVDAKHARKGVANAMVALAEKTTKKTVIPSKKNLISGKALWAQKNRPFGKSKFKPTKKALLIGAGVAATAAGVAYLANKKSEKIDQKALAAGAIAATTGTGPLAASLPSGFTILPKGAKGGRWITWAGKRLYIKGKK